MILVTRKISSPGRPGLTDEQKDSIAKLYNEGDTVADISKTFGRSPQTIRRVIKSRRIMQGGGGEMIDNK